MMWSIYGHLAMHIALLYNHMRGGVGSLPLTCWNTPICTSASVIIFDLLLLSFTNLTRSIGITQSAGCDPCAWSTVENTSKLSSS